MSRHKFPFFICAFFKGRRRVRPNCSRCTIPRPFLSPSHDFARRNCLVRGSGPLGPSHFCSFSAVYILFFLFRPIFRRVTPPGALRNPPQKLYQIVRKIREQCAMTCHSGSGYHGDAIHEKQAKKLNFEWVVMVAKGGSCQSVPLQQMSFETFSPILLNNL